MSETPFPGLRAFSEEEAGYFCGRKRFVEVVKANFLSSPITLLYGPSGVGKSSLLRAGVVHELSELGKRRRLETRPEFRSDLIVIYHSRWELKPLDGLLERLQIGLGAKQVTLEASVREWSRENKGDVLIILDQFEECLPYFESRGEFIEQLTSVMDRSDLPVNFLISIRADMLADLARLSQE
jgi:hypothetical protein